MRREINVKHSKRIWAALCCLTLLLAMVLPAAAEDGFSTSYTYTYDYWEDVQESPDAYRVATVIDSMTLGMDKLDNRRLTRAQSLFAIGDALYICDTGNNRILEIIRKDGQYTLSRVITEMKGAQENTFSSPYDIAADEEGNLYVADYGHQRVTKMDRDLNWIQDFIKPTDATFDQSLNFLPKKIVIDVAGRVYALCQNVNKGLVKYEADGTFSGFIGANAVSVSMTEYIWKRYFQTKE